MRLRGMGGSDRPFAFTTAAFALLLVVGIAQVMQLAGVSMALGAFLAGVLLASSEYRHALETDVEPFKGLLLGLFFIAVGMSIDFALLARNAWLLLGLVVGFVALKTALLIGIARATGVPRGRHLLFAGLLCQGSEFAFVVFGVAGQVRVLPDEWGKLLTLVVALSMVATPLIVLAADAMCRWMGTRDERPDDAIEGEDAPVILAGFGRFGQIVGRLLFASGLRATVLDHDPDNIEILRRLGFRGVAITDSVSVFGSEWAVRTARRAVRAGADLVLLTNGPDAERVIDALVPMARRGQLDEHVRRVLAFRRWLGLRELP